MQRRKLTRRTLLCGLGAVAATGVAGLVWSRTGRVGREDGLDRLLRTLRGPRAAGRAYLEAHPNERDAGRLVQAIFEDRPGASRSVSALRGHVIERTRRDFESGDVVNAAGWILGRTEARLLALAWLRR